MVVGMEGEEVALMIEEEAMTREEEVGMIVEEGMTEGTEIETEIMEVTETIETEIVAKGGMIERDTDQAQDQGQDLETEGGDTSR